MFDCRRHRKLFDSFKMDLDGSKRRYDVIIVGGGMAGLSAAENLSATSGGKVGRVLVLEAGQRLVGTASHLIVCLLALFLPE